MQAIDLIDEAGSRVRLQHAQLPEEARELDKELRALMKEKETAVRGQDFEKAGQVQCRSSFPVKLVLSVWFCHQHPSMISALAGKHLLVLHCKCNISWAVG